MSNLSWVSWTLKKPQAVGVILSVVCACQVMPGPRLGSILGQRAISITQFCKEFNEKTKDVKEGFPLSTKIFINPDRTFEFKKGQPTIYYFLKAAAFMEKGALQTGKEVAGLMSLKHTYTIDCVKAKDEVFAMQGVPLSSVVHSITGSARSLGIRVVKDLSAEALAAFQKERAMPLAAQKEADLAAQAEAAKK